MSVPEARNPTEEGRHHTYVGTAIPWYVRLMWVGFWVMTAYYVLTFLIPALKIELVSPP
ncbi:MAG: hypothetical protein JSS02_02795 [Planctomycetes bacterium]|nr:hypothetical protein [Planctomycetota bacterium]